MENQEFRFTKKTDYEKELEKILKSLKRKRNPESLAEKYEELMEEYLQFCAEQDA
jgi:hypothetical protein